MMEEEQNCPATLIEVVAVTGAVGHDSEPEAPQGCGRRGKPPKKPNQLGQWRCSRCRVYKSEEHFSRHARNGNGLESACKECLSKAGTIQGVAEPGDSPTTFGQVVAAHSGKQLKQVTSPSLEDDECTQREEPRALDCFGTVEELVAVTTARPKGMMKEPDSFGHWQCSKCGVYKSSESFYLQAKAGNGLASACKECIFTLDGNIQML